MGRNVEIKAKARDLEYQRTLADALADSGPQVFYQEDTFFNCTNGRLKLRSFPDGMGELIYYQRQDCVEPAESNYVRSVIKDPESLMEALSNALGGFIELEVVLRAGEAQGSGAVVAKDLMARLGIQAEDLMKSAYVDLLFGDPQK